MDDQRSPFESPLDRRQFHGVVVGALAVALGAPAMGRVMPVEVDVEPDVIDGVLRMGIESADTPLLLSQELTGGTFNLAGLTWAPGAAGVGSVLVRARQDGLWGAWTRLETDADMPDPGSGPVPRPGTTPFITGAADAIEARVDPMPGESLPEDLRLDLVDGGPMPTGIDAATSTEAVETASTDLLDEEVELTSNKVGSTLAAAAPRPAFNSRNAWGADETLRANYGQPIQYGQVLGTFVHHTAGSNAYTQSEVPAILRSIYRYHVVSRNFWDIGYNILVDRFGRLWEGAFGGLDRNVVAAHTQYYNSAAFGISAIGTYTSKAVEPAVRTALAQAIAWKFSVHGIATPWATANYPGSNARSQPRIAGHRHAKSTECPGGSLYAQLTNLRHDVASRLKVASSLSMSAPAVTARGARTTLDIRWTAEGSNLAGLVNLQRLKNGAWEHVRSVQVSGGRAETVITPGATNQYRLRASSCSTRSDIDLSHPRGTSNTVTITVRNVSLPFVELAGPASVSRGARTTLRITWLSGNGPVSGKINLQRRNGSSWEHVRQIDVKDGGATTVITPGATNSYRLRASTVSSPPGVPTRDPQGTSNTLRVTVR
ncbi:N-acetylmuramoyl-L-alanine amidase [Oerskovia flava]|uniref:N-acetylmuramoyl-L-alanine amidase n=1 Tax=Oerskovia flava TaxID=2986422 RepID=UPI0022402024|nr:N-acetylmuramoyl-L-alanine amidase [Oerskovia sp. JB1-3-2]